MLGACGFAATGRDLGREQGFAASTFRWLIENQNHIAWTPEALAADAQFRARRAARVRWTRPARVGVAGSRLFPRAARALN